MNKHAAGVAAAFTAMGILGLALLNFTFSPGYIWFYYAAFAALWWPLAMVCRRNPLGFALAGSAMTMVFLAVVNLQNSPHYPWFLYTVAPLAWWPIGVYFGSRGKARGLAIAGSVLMMAYLIVINCLFTPGYPWFWYVLPPLIWWPVVLHLGRRAGTLAFALICSAITLACYAVLNALLCPGYPWVIFLAFALAWWPLSMHFARKRQPFGYSVASSLLTIVFFAVVNFMTTPAVPWALYPAFAVLWWPLSVFCAKRKSWLGYSLAGALLASAFFVAVNLITSPSVLWSVFPIFAVLWWPLSIYYFRYRKMKLAGQ